MTRLPFALCALILAGCAAQPRPYAPVRGIIAYQALGNRQFWVLTIGDDRILLHDGARPDRIWPRTLPRIEEDQRIWQLGEGADAVRIVARSGPCTAVNGDIYADFVSVHFGHADLDGCGGRRIGQERG
jgi:uncharacterized membrane protein